MTRWDARTVAGIERVVRTAAVDALADIEPGPLRQRVHEEVGAASLAPGSVVLAGTSKPVHHEAADGPAAGVQLMYDGLRLTRALVETNPWATDGTREAGDLAVLAADILVARGFYLLADTPVANLAVSVVRSFGRDESTPSTQCAGAGHLECSVLDLALETRASIGNDAQAPVDSMAVVDRLPTTPGPSPGFPNTQSVLRVIDGQVPPATDDDSVSSHPSASSVSE
jgi:hypothetical protein